MATTRGKRPRKAKKPRRAKKPTTGIVALEMLKIESAIWSRTYAAALNAMLGAFVEGEVEQSDVPRKTAALEALVAVRTWRSLR